LNNIALVQIFALTLMLEFVFVTFFYNRFILKEWLFGIIHRYG